MLRNSTPESGLGFAREFHQGRTLAAGVRTHDRLDNVPGRGQHFLPFQEQLRTFPTAWGFLCRGLDTDFIARSLGRPANPENESGSIRRWRPTHREAGLDPYLLVMPCGDRSYFRRKRPRNSRAAKRDGP